MTSSALGGLCLRRIVPSRADANTASIEGDDVSDLQLPSASAINLAVHGHIAVDDGLFHVSTGVEEPSELQELPEANDLTADRDVVDRSRVRHPRMLVDQVPAPTPVGHRTPPGGSSRMHELSGGTEAGRMVVSLRESSLQSEKAAYPAVRTDLRRVTPHFRTAHAFVIGRDTLLATDHPFVDAEPTSKRFSHARHLGPAAARFKHDATRVGRDVTAGGLQLPSATPADRASVTFLPELDTVGCTYSLRWSR
jgi:hypothetical protein